MCKLKIVALLILSSVTSFSCKKFLDKKQSTSLVSPSTLKDLQGLLDDAGNVMNRSLTPGLGEASNDDNFLLQSDWEMMNTTDQHFYTWTKYPYFFTNDWAKSYTPVYSANYCLEELNKTQRTISNRESWDNIKGAALFYRSYNFLNLLWNHSKAYNKATSDTDLGIVLRLSSDFNKKSVRASVEQCYQKVLEDTKASVALLPEMAAHVYRPSKCAAYGLLARAYLSMRVYDSAYKYANLSLNIKNTLLNYGSLNMNVSKPFAAFNDETVFYTKMYSSTSITGFGLIDTVLYDSYANTDLRKRGFFRASGKYFGFKGSYATSGLFTGIATDEMILTRAECSARIGHTQDALNDINYLLKHRYDATFTPYNISSDGELIKTILSERRKELIRRGLRWMDIKRLNAEGANINLMRVLNGKTYQLQANSDYFALPLPTDVVEIAGIVQNP